MENISRSEVCLKIFDWFIGRDSIFIFAARLARAYACPQISLDIRESQPIIHLVRNPVKKQMNMIENSLLCVLPSSAMKPELTKR
jgi:hypothetical protein